MSRLLITTPDGIEILNKYLSLDLGEGKFISITPSAMDYPKPGETMNPELKEIIQRGKWAVEFLDEKKENLSPDFDRPRFENAKSKKLLVAVHAALAKPTELMVLAKNSLSAEDLKDVEETFIIEYAPRYGYSSITIESSQFTEVTDENQKVVFFVSGKDADECAKVITKEKPGTKIITGDNVNTMDIELAKAMKDSDLKLLVVNTSIFSKNDIYYFSRTLKTEGYAIQTITLTPAVEKTIPEEEKSGAVNTTTTTSEKKKLSELAKQTKITGYKYFDTPEEKKKRIINKAIQMELIQSADEVEDDTPIPQSDESTS